MAQFGIKSKQKLLTCHPNLQLLMNEVIKHIDFTIIQGIRSKEEQVKLVAEGKSKTMKSKHLEQADGFSHAVDIAPWISNHPDKIPWNEPKYFYVLAGHVQKAAALLNIEIRWGGDFNQNGLLSDDSFRDLPHFELK